MKKILKWTIVGAFLAVIAVGGFCLWILYGSKTSNPNNYKTIGDIPVPWGYERISADDVDYANFLRSLPDVCMRLRAEYLFSTGQYGRIRFQNVNGKTLSYGGGSSRKSFERYLRYLYGVASTFSLSREMKTRRLADMQPGDVFVYPARYGQRYGHAVMVVDVAINNNGKKAFLLAEGNTPAREIHVMRNFENPFRSPWFMLDEDADNLILSVFHYKATDLKHF